MGIAGSMDGGPERDETETMYAGVESPSSLKEQFAKIIDELPQVDFSRERDALKKIQGLLSSNMYAYTSQEKRNILSSLADSVEQLFPIAKKGADSERLQAFGQIVEIAKDSLYYTHEKRNEDVTLLTEIADRLLPAGHRWSNAQRRKAFDSILEYTMSKSPSDSIVDVLAEPASTLLPRDKKTFVFDLILRSFVPDMVRHPATIDHQSLVVPASRLVKAAELFLPEAKKGTVAQRVFDEFERFEQAKKWKGSTPLLAASALAVEVMTEDMRYSADKKEALFDKIATGFIAFAEGPKDSAINPFGDMATVLVHAGSELLPEDRQADVLPILTSLHNMLNTGKRDRDYEYDKYIKACAESLKGNKGPAFDSARDQILNDAYEHSLAVYQTTGDFTAFGRVRDVAKDLYEGFEADRSYILEIADKVAGHIVRTEADLERMYLVSKLAQLHTRYHHDDQRIARQNIGVNKGPGGLMLVFSQVAPNISGEMVCFKAEEGSGEISYSGQFARSEDPRDRAFIKDVVVASLG